MVEWFKAAVLKTADAQASGSSNLPLSAIFVPKNGERSRKASLPCHAGVSTEAEHLHQSPEALLACPAVALAKADEDAPFGRL